MEMNKPFQGTICYNIVWGRTLYCSIQEVYSHDYQIHSLALIKANHQMCPSFFKKQDDQGYFLYLFINEKTNEMRNHHERKDHPM